MQIVPAQRSLYSCPLASSFEFLPSLRPVATPHGNADAGAWRRCTDFGGQPEGTLLRLFLAGQGTGLARQGRAGQGNKAGQAPPSSWGSACSQGVPLPPSLSHIEAAHHACGFLPLLRRQLLAILAGCNLVSNPNCGTCSTVGLDL